MQQPAAVPPDEAAQTLEAVRTTRKATRERLRPYWFGYVVFGLLTMISSWLFDVWDGGGLALFWLLAAPVGWVVVSRHQRTEQREHGATRSGRPYALGAAILVVPACVLGAIGAAVGEPDVVSLGVPAILAGSQFVLAWTHRDATAAVVGLALLALVAWAATSDLEGATILTGLGGGWVIMGLTSRKSQRDEARAAETTDTAGA